MVRVLRSQVELFECRKRLRARGLDFTDRRRLRLWALVFWLRYRHAMPVPDVIKSWDVWNALAMIEQAEVEHSAPVLDMGCHNSEILYVLHAAGFRRLYGCDLNPLCQRLAFWHRIQYRAGDITRTPYPSHFFGAITCLSVIEHGVPVERLVSEVARLLRPGGIFIMTTDFDPTIQRHLISDDLKPFGLDWQIFTREGLQRVLNEFESAGLSLLEPEESDLNHVERPINWNGHTYTFAMAVLRARGQ